MSYFDRGFIRSVELELPKYEFKHSDKNHGHTWVNRDEVEQQLKNLLYDTSCNQNPENKDEQKTSQDNRFHGIYLVTGYRGTGKSSLVRTVLEALQERYTNDGAHKKYHEIKLSLNQENLTEIDIYRQLIANCVFKLREMELKIPKLFNTSPFFKNKTVASLEARSAFSSWKYSYMMWLTRIVLCLTLVMSIYFMTLRTDEAWNIFKGNWYFFGCKWFWFLVPISLLPMLVRYLMFERIKKINSVIIDAHRSMTKYLIRLDSTVEEEGQQGASTYINFMSRRKTQFKSGNPKELQIELIEILKRLYKEGIGFYFIFDELDKLEDSSNRISYFKFQENNESDETTLIPDEELRSRKQKILNIIGSMKFFLNSCPGKFIFIAGREMFDASLADVSDRNQSLGSIFHSTLYVDSFLKDKGAKLDRQGISVLTEKFLEHVLMTEEESKKTFNLDGIDKSDSFLKRYFQFMKNDCYINNEDPRKKESDPQSQPSGEALSERNLEYLKVIYVLQQFIVYLVYRGNGSPKKINKIIDTMVYYNEYVPTEGDDFKTIRVHHKGTTSTKRKAYLRLSFSNQYRFGLINYIYRPYLITNSKYTRTLTDQNLVHTPFMFDHLIKFHPYAFSRNDLELLPEVLSSNRTPEIRYHLDELIEWMSHNLIRETEVGFYEFKFFHKIYNELSYITKLFEEESAALNFTLDESHPIKLSIRVRIKELRSIYKGFNTGGTLHSLSFLNAILGDAHMLDQEFMDAVVAYQDSLYALERESDNRQENLHQELKIRMKLALCFERMKAFESAQNEYIKVSLLTGDFKALRSGNRHGITSYVKYHHLAILSRLFLKEKQMTSSVDNEDISWFLDSYRKSHLQFRGIDKLEFRWPLLHMGLLFFYKNMSLRDCNALNEIVLNFKKAFAKLTNGDKIEIPKLMEFAFGPTSTTTQTASKYQVKDSRTPEGALLIYCMLLQEFIQSKEKANRTDNSSEQSLNNPVTQNVSAIPVSTNTTEPSSGESESNQSAANTVTTTLPSNQSQLAESLKKLNEILINNTYELSKGELTYIASLLSKLGDSLFAFGIFLDPKTKSLITESTKIQADVLGFHEFTNQGKQPGSELQQLIHYLIDKNDSNIVHNKFRLLISTYLVASEFYLKSGKSVSASFQFRKIINVLRTCIETKDLKSDSTFFEKTEQIIISRILRISSWNSGSSDRPQIYKYKEILDIHTVKHPPEYSLYNYMNISNSSELKEGLYQYAGLKIRCYDLSKCTTLKDCLDQIPETQMINTTNGVSVQFARLNEFNLMYEINNKLITDYLDKKLNGLLKYWGVEGYRRYKKMNSTSRLNMIDHVRSHFNDKVILNSYSFAYNSTPLLGPSKKTKIHLEDLLNTIILGNEIVTKIDTRIKKYNLPFAQFAKAEVLQESFKIDNIKELIDNFIEVVANNIFVLHSMNTIYTSLGVGFTPGYCSLADTQRRFGDVLKLYELIKILEDITVQDDGNQKKKGRIKYKIDEKVNLLIGNGVIAGMDTTSMYQSSILNYYKTIQFHHCGSSYKNLIANLNFLEDDFNDHLYHYGMAYERMRMNCDQIRKQINELIPEVKESQVTSYTSYVGSVKQNQAKKVTNP